jgi:hypothetical protein
MSSLGNLVVNIGANTRELNKALGQVQRDIRTTTGNIQSLGRQMSMAFTAPLALIGGSAFNTFQKFEQQMAKVRAVSGATSTEFAALKANAEELGASTRFSATEVAELQTEFAKLGFTAAEIENVTEGTLALAQATDSDLAQAAEVAGNVLRAFQLEASETGRVTDVMAQSFNSTALDMETFSLSMKFVAPVAASAGVSLEETTALLGLLADAGIKGSTAGTSLRRIISELGAGSEPVTEKIKQLAAGGLDLTSAMDEVGREAQSALLVLGNNIDKVDGLTKGLEDSAGAAKEMAGIMDDTSQGALKRMQSAVEGAQIKLGEALAPAIISVMDGVANLASYFSTLSQGTQRAVVIFGALLAAVGPILIMLPQLVQGVALLKVAMMQGLIPALVKVNAVMMANPWVLAAAAVAALSYAIYELATQTSYAEESMTKMADIQQRISEEVNTTAGKVMALARIVEDETQSEKKRIGALKELQKIAPEHFGNLDMEQVKMGQLSKSVDAYRDSILRAAKTRIYSEELEAALKVQAEFQEKINNKTQEYKELVEKGAGAAANSAQKKIKAYETELNAADKIVTEILDKMVDLNDVPAPVDRASELRSEFIALNKTLKQTKEGTQAYSDVSNAIAEVKAELDSLTKKTEAPAAKPKVIEDVKKKSEEAKVAVEQLSFEALQLQELMQSSVIGDLDARKIRQESMGGELDIKEIDGSEQYDEGIVNEENIALANDYASAIDRINEKNQSMLNMTQSISGELGRMFSTMIDGSMTAADALKQFGISVLKTMIGVARAHVIATYTNPANPVNAATGGLAMPLLIAGGLTLVETLLGAVAFANGGIVSGPTLGLVGEYAGARNNPEVIAPLDKLRDIMADTSGGRQEVMVTGRISGNDIELISERGRNNLRRSR